MGFLCRNNTVTLTLIWTGNLSESTSVRTFKTAPNNFIRIEVLESRSHGSFGINGRMGYQETIESTSQHCQIDEPPSTQATTTDFSTEQHADDSRKSTCTIEV